MSVEPRRRSERDWRPIAGIGAAALIVLAVLLVATGVLDGGGGGGGLKAEFTPFSTQTDVGDLDARGDKIAFLAPASDSSDQKQVARVDLGGGPVERVSPAAKYNGIDIGLDSRDHAKLVYSRIDESGAYHVFTKPFRGEEQAGPVPSAGCNDGRPSMWEGMIVFARGGTACGQRGLMLKRRNSSELQRVTGANSGADMSDGTLVWRATPRRLVARSVTPDGKLGSAEQTLDAPDGEEFGTPLVVENGFVYFVHKQSSQDFIARARLPLGGSQVEHYVQSDDDNGAEEAPHFGVTGTTLYITNYPQRNGDPGTRMVMRVRNPTFEPAG